MTITATYPIPEIGQIVTVRQRRYVVSDVQQSAIPLAVLSATSNNFQHLVSLSSIEDDALGETLQVVWEIEPNANVNEKTGLPVASGFDTPQRFDDFLNTVRWGAISSADIRSLQAPFRNGITIEDYQPDPLVRAVQIPLANVLIADDVGLGKTIEAGLHEKDKKNPNEEDPARQKPNKLARCEGHLDLLAEPELPVEVQTAEFLPPTPASEIGGWDRCKCLACGKSVMGFSIEEHTRVEHQGKNPEYRKGAGNG